MQILLDFLKLKKNVRLLGKTSHLRSDRMPTVSFTVDGMSSYDIAVKAGKKILVFVMVNFMLGDV